MFTTFIVQPIFNLLVLIYAILPHHNFGLAIIIFTVVVRILLWPLVKKQLHHAKAMRALQPELKKIKKAAKGDRRKESQLVMELYKEREINPFSSLGIVLVQIPILIGLYVGISRLIKDPQQIIDLAYPALQNLSWMKELAADISKFDATLFGWIDLTRPALGAQGLYIPALILVTASAISQFFQSRQLMPAPEESRSLRKILREAGQGKSTDQSEVNVAVGRSMLYLIPGFVFIFGLGLPAALPLYWLTSSLVALVQQTIILREDVGEAEAIADAPAPSKKKVAKKKTPEKQASKPTPKPSPEPTKPSTAGLTAAELAAQRDQAKAPSLNNSPAKPKNRKNRRRRR